MSGNIGERLASVETQVGAIQATQVEMAADVRLVRDYVLAQQAKSRLYKQVLTGFAGVVAFCTAAVKVFGFFSSK
jgi:hypothetical protein